MFNSTKKQIAERIEADLAKNPLVRKTLDSPLESIVNRLYGELVERVKKELREDPQKRFYKDKEISDIMYLINEPYTVNVQRTDNIMVLNDDTGEVKPQEVTFTVSEFRNARIYDITIGLPYAPNRVEGEVLEEAMNNA